MIGRLFARRSAAGAQTLGAEAVSQVREIVGRIVQGMEFWRHRAGLKSVDETRTDYGFWDLLRRGKAKGYAFGGLFCKPLTEIVASFVLGDGAGFAVETAGDVAAEESATETADDLDYTNTLLSRWAGRQHAGFLTLLEDLYALGDQYVVVNPDGSLSVPSPETVELQFADLDYREVVAATITTELDAATVRDEYRLDGRTVTVKWKKATKDGQHWAGQEETFNFENLTGRLPLVHFANDRGTNETHGRPIYEALLDLFARYDDLVTKGLDGAELHGNPMPVVEGADNPEQVAQLNGEEEEFVDEKSGETKTRLTIFWDRLTMLILGKGASFKFASPQVGFSGDIRDMLKSLFYLVMDHTRVPEFLWGGAISSSKASAEVQFPPFLQFIAGRRAKLAGVGADDLLGDEAKGGLLELADIWLRTRALVDPRVVVGPVKMIWPPLSEQAAEMRFKWTEFARLQGLITGETVLRAGLSDVVPDPAKELVDAKAETEAMRLAEDDYATRLDMADVEAWRDAAEQRMAALEARLGGVSGEIEEVEEMAA